MGGHLYFRLHAMDFASRTLERVGRSVNHLAASTEKDAQVMALAYGKVTRAAELSAEKVIRASMLRQEQMLEEQKATAEMAIKEAESWMELARLIEGAQVRIAESEQMLNNKTRHFATARIAALEEQRVAVLDLAASTAEAARTEIAAIDEKMVALRAATEENVKNIAKEAEAQNLATKEKVASQNRMRDVMGGASTSMMVGGGALLLGSGGAAVGLLKMAEAAANFDSMLVMTINHANMLPSELEQVKQGLLALSPQTGFGPQALADAFYNVQSRLTSLYSDGLPHTADKLNIMRESAKLAAVGHANLTDTTKTLLSVLTAYGAENLSASDAASKLNTIIGLGDVNMQQFASAMRNGLLPVAAQAGITLDSLGAAYGTLTDLGYGTAQSATYLRSAIITMAMPTGPATKALEALGLGTKEARKHVEDFSKVLEKAGINQTVVAQKLRSSGSLAETIKMLKDRMIAMGVSGPEAIALVERAFGGIRSGSGAVGLFSNLDGLVAKEETIIHKTQDWDATWRRFQETDPAGAVHRWHAGIQTLEQRVGDALIPTLLWLMTIVNPFVERISDWVQHNGKLLGTLVPIVIAVGGLLGVLLLAGGALGFLVMGFGAMSGALPVILGLMAGAAAVIGIVTAAVIYGHKHWKELVTFYNNHIAPSVKLVGEIFQELGAVIRTATDYIIPQLEGMGSKIAEAMERPNSPLRDFQGLLESGLKSVKSFVKSELFADLVANFAVYVPKALMVTVNSFMLLYQIAALVMGQMVTVVKVGLDILNHDFGKAGKDLQSGWDDANNRIVAISQAATDQVNSVTDLFSDKTRTQWDSLRAHILGAAEDATKPLPGKFEAALEGVKNSIDKEDRDLAVKSKYLGNHISTGVSDGVMEEGHRIHEELGSAISSATAQGTGNASGLGYDIAAGVAAGVGSGSNLVYDSITGLVRESIARGRGAAEAYSPARRFARELGLPMGQGVGVGIEQAIPHVSSAMSNLVDAAIANGVAVSPTVGVNPVAKALTGTAAGSSGADAADHAATKHDIEEAQLKALRDIAACLHQMKAGSYSSGNPLASVSTAPATAGTPNSDLWNALQEAAYLKNHYGG